MKILSIDPGVHNYAYSLISDESDEKVLFKDHLKNPLQSIKKGDITDNLKLYLWEITDLLKKASLREDDYIIAERYQPRGHRNNQIELVNIMLGILADKVHNRIILVMPTTWKTYMKNKYGSNDMLKLLKVKCESEHIADSIGIGAFAFERYFNKNIMSYLI